MKPITEIEPITDKEMEDEFIKEMKANDAHTAAIEAQLPAALRTLLALATGSPHRRYGIAAAEILRAAHHKSGAVETSNLGSLDPDNRRAAMIVLEACARPSILSDRGLVFDGAGNPRLTADEVQLIA